MRAWKGSEPRVRVPALAVSQHALEMIKKQFESVPLTVGNPALLHPRRGANGRENRGALSSNEEGKTAPRLLTYVQYSSRLFTNPECACAFKICSHLILFLFPYKGFVSSVAAHASTGYV